MNMGHRAAFIVIEGLDRSGKSTQAAILLGKLQQQEVPVRLIKFPDRTTPIGKMIDAYLRSESELDDHAVHLLFSANRWELAASIETSLNAGTIVLCDRYAFSGIAFSTAKGLPYEWCRSPDVSLPAPDLTLFFDISPEDAKERGGYGEERYEKEEMQRRVREVFVGRIATEMTMHQIAEERTHWAVIQAQHDVSTVSQNVWREVQPLCQGMSSPIGKLWSP